MGSKKKDRVQNKMEITYEQYVHACFDGLIQLSREFEITLGKEVADEIIGKARIKADLQLVKKQLSGKTITTFEEFKEFMKEIHKSSFAKHLFNITYYEKTPAEIEFHTTKCLLAKVFRELGAADLGYIMMCQPDFVTTPTYFSGATLKRSKTLMQGNDYCDTTYYVMEEK